MSTPRVVDLRGLEAARAVVDPEIHRKAWRRTVNDLTRRSNTATAKQIRQRYTVKARELKRKTRVQLLTGSSETASIRVEGKRMGLLAFAGTRQVKAGVSVQIRRGGPRKVIPHAWIDAEKRNAWRRRWRRLHPDAPPAPARPPAQYGRLPRVYRLPVERVTSLGPAEMFDHPNVYDEVEAVIDRDGHALYDRHYAYYAGQR